MTKHYGTGTGAGIAQAAPALHRAERAAGTLALPVRRPAVDAGQLARWETDPAPWRERATAAARYLPDSPLATGAFGP